MANHEVNREGFWADFANAMSWGMVFTIEGIGHFVTHYGYRSGSANEVMVNPHTKIALENDDSGLKLAAEEYKRVKLFLYDGLAPEQHVFQTDLLEELHKEIDIKKASGISKMKRTMGYID